MLNNQSQRIYPDFMEHDIETFLKAFNQHLLTYEKPLLTESQKEPVTGWCLGHSNGQLTKTSATASGYSANSLRDGRF